MIIDATFYENVLRIPFYQLAEKLSCKLYIFNIQANEDLIKERTSLVRADSEADFNVYLTLKNKERSSPQLHERVSQWKL